MPGRPITDQQHRLYMTLRQKHPQTTAAAMAGFSPSTGHRAEKDPRLPSERGRDRRHGGGKPDPLAGLWEEEIVPLLRATPSSSPITVLEEMQRRHPERDLMSAHQSAWNRDPRAADAAVERRPRGRSRGDLPAEPSAGTAGHVRFRTLIGTAGRAIWR